MPSPPPPQIERWSVATVGVNFKDKVAAEPLYADLRIKYEGHDEPIPQKDTRQWIEVRVDGPLSREVSRNFWHFRIEVNILVSTIMDDKDWHDHPDLCGHVRSWFPKCMPLRKYGNRPGDDANVIVGQYVLDTSFRNQTLLANFGQVDPKIRLVQSTVEGHYDMKETF